MTDWKALIFDGGIDFSDKLERIFKYQFENNPVYRRYCEALNPEILKQVSFAKATKTKVQNDKNNFPLLPIRAFKDTSVTTKPAQEPELVFKSSGTSDMKRSKHRVMDASLYEQSLLNGFGQFYDLEKSVIWGYTPGYSDNPHSSLIYMIQTLIKQDESGLSRFLPLDEPLKKQGIEEIRKRGKQLILFGAAFGLLDLLEMEKVELPSNSFIIETGGMKTHRREILRKELHKKLAKEFSLDYSRIHSEYGMAELLSQAYATGGEWFRTVPWMKVSIRDPDNPFEKQSIGQEGLIGVIDLANVHSCSFLLTEDKGVMDRDGRFKVMGRWNPKDLRGCNFLIDQD